MLSRGLRAWRRGDTRHTEARWLTHQRLSAETVEWSHVIATIRDECGDTSHTHTRTAYRINNVTSHRTAVMSILLYTRARISCYLVKPYI